MHGAFTGERSDAGLGCWALHLHGVPAGEQGARREGAGQGTGTRAPRDGEVGLAQAGGGSSVSGRLATQSPRCRLWAENSLESPNN